MSTPLPPVDEVESFLATCSEIESITLRDRIFATDPVPVHDMAVRLRVAPEHAVRIEHRSRTRAFDALRRLPSLRALGDRILEVARPVASLSRVASAIPDTTRTIPSLRIPLWSLISQMDERLSVESGWVFSPTRDAARDELSAVVARNSTIDGITPLRAVAEHFGMPAAELEDFAAGYRVLDGNLVPLDLPVAGQLASILASTGTPMSMPDLMDRMQPTRSASSVRNALVTDARFVKTDRTLWALTRWGIPPYVPIHRQIASIVDDRGSIEIDRLVAEITGSYDVKEQSIRTYASTGEFVTENEIVTRRRHSYTPRKSPSKTKHLYRGHGVVRWRTTVTAIHRKGSAFNLPSALAALLNVGPGTPRSFDSRLGGQSVMWVSVQARSGTIKRFVDDLDLTEGEEIFLEFGDDGTFDVVRADLPHTDPATRILGLIGRRARDAADDSTVLAEVADAVWLPNDATRAEVVSILSSRKEFELRAAIEHLPISHA
ncbi:hypothetical protein [Rhodococcoides kyotonense]|uniref:Uncharacterized protein n=1 Tax=Rhodococcoides kyotonense TaxID=398843 RepID=A0A177YGC9_9NOCA|nr:hypothetical protein [Rhodococcus kyotonensis]OAK54563.1 hypothetical protein A3K89_04190 [Rhodococcus kyotonensis]